MLTVKFEAPAKDTHLFVIPISFPMFMPSSSFFTEETVSSPSFVTAVAVLLRTSEVRKWF